MKKPKIVFCIGDVHSYDKKLLEKWHKKWDKIARDIEKESFKNVKLYKKFFYIKSFFK